MKTIKNGGELLSLFEHRLTWPNGLELNPAQASTVWMVDAIYRVLQSNAQRHSAYQMASSMLVPNQIIGFVGKTRSRELNIYPVDFNGVEGLHQLKEPWTKLSIAINPAKDSKIPIAIGDMVLAEVKKVEAGKWAEVVILANFGSIP